MDKVPVIGVSRHRIGTDGAGVTTLVAFHGCELRCRHCLNPQSLKPNAKVKYHTPETLLEEVVKDGLYFQATGGGITFGGGEPGLQADFICRFKQLCPDGWKIRLETSLNFPAENVQKLAKAVDQWIVDIKTTDPAVYREYTGKERACSQNNLDRLSSLVSKDKIMLRIPVIPGFTSLEDAEKSKTELMGQGFAGFDVFEYRTDIDNVHRQPEDGKRKCEILKSIRREVAESNGIDFVERECTHKGNCPGTCPACESDLERLGKEIERRNQLIRRRYEAFEERITSDISYAPADSNQDCLTPGVSIDDIEGLERLPTIDELKQYQRLQGDVRPPEREMGILGDFPERTFLKECAVAGVSFHVKYDDELWEELDEGQEVALVRDRKNKYDKNAVAVALADDFDGDADDFDFDFILGYLPRTENSDIAAMLDEGQTLYAELTTVKRHGNINDRLRVTIYLEETDESKPAPLLRAVSLDENELSSFESQLNQGGLAHFRWGGYPLQEMNLPKKGERIVLVHKRKEDILLYLTFVLAKGAAECSAMTSDIADNRDDDSMPYLVTNICGPISIKPGPFGFLLSDSIANLSVGKYLTPEMSDGFKSIFSERRLAEP